MCEEIIDDLDNQIPDVDENNKPVMTVRFNKLAEMRLSTAIEEFLIPDIEEYYGFTYKGMYPFEFEWYPQNCKNNKQRCENSILSSVNGKKSWFRTSGKDFCGIIFLNDYNDKPPLDSDFEVHGGKLQFLNHNFSVNPKRGTLVVFPGEQHFINCTSDINIGDLHQIRFFINSTEIYKYNPKSFPGNHKSWFA
jgi:hypothetical protein